MQESTNSEISVLTKEEQQIAYNAIYFLLNGKTDIGNVGILLKAGRIVDAYADLPGIDLELKKAESALKEFVKILREKNIWKDIL